MEAADQWFLVAFNAFLAAKGLDLLVAESPGTEAGFGKLAENYRAGLGTACADHVVGRGPRLYPILDRGRRRA